HSTFFVSSSFLSFFLSTSLAFTHIIICSYPFVNHAGYLYHGNDSETAATHGQRARLLNLSLIATPKVEKESISHIP
ncbi:hypothetical protein L249_1334, partial [Ophiocordyceps polyrhachis-furcata BCC 54312]